MSIKTNVKAFWTYFLKNQTNIEQALATRDKKIISEWEKKLGEKCLQCAGCYCSLEKDDELNLLVFEPMKDKTSQIICVYMKKFTPKSLSDHWIVFDCIPPLSEKINHYHFQVDEQDYTIQDMQIGFIETPKVADSFSISLVCAGFANMNENEKDVIGMTFVQNVLGDLVLNSYVESVDCVDKPLEGVDYVPLEEGYDVLIDFMDLHHYKIYSDCTQIYSVYKLENNQIEDELLKDRILISTIQPLHFVEVMNQQRNGLNAITRLQGEVGFLVLEIEALNEQEIQRKRVLEKELNDLLYDLGIARICGSGLAQKRIYFEVFIFDKEEFKKAIVKVVAQLKLPLTYIAY